MPHCPACQAEYAEGAEECNDCLESRNERVKLVPGPPQSEASQATNRGASAISRWFRHRSPAVRTLRVGSFLFLLLGIAAVISDFGDIIANYQRENEGIFYLIHYGLRTLIFRLEPAVLAFGFATLAAYLLDLKEVIYANSSSGEGFEGEDSST